MVRLILENKYETSWFQQFRFLKAELELKLRECIKLFYHIKKGRTILIQPCKDELPLNLKLDISYHRLKPYFYVEMSDISSVFNSLVDANHYTCYIVDYYRGYRIYISRT